MGLSRAFLQELGKKSQVGFSPDLWMGLFDVAKEGVQRLLELPLLPHHDIQHDDRGQEGAEEQEDAAGGKEGDDRF